MTTDATFLWHDFETFGTSPKKDLPCQFAAIRTDMDLNVVGKPINIMSQIANDYLPQPGACLVTGITPQQTLRDGMAEAQFAMQIARHMCQPNTCVAGYNSIRFDDEVTRHLFHRNFIDPYAREWRNGNSRWDIIDLARACYALRPDGIHWPVREDGTPSFRLEHLTAENALAHGQAHDALSDVYATIALAKLIKEKQPKLFEYALSLRNKQTVLAQLNTSKPSVVLHVSSKLPARHGCATWVMPIAMHPTNANAVIVVDLAKDVDGIIELSAEEIAQRLYARSDELGDEPRPGLKLIHINRSPFITTAKAMTQDNAQRLDLNREYCLENFKKLAAASNIAQKVTQIYDTHYDNDQEDPDHALYSGGFLNNDERRWCNEVIEQEPEQLAAMSEKTQNQTLRTMLFRYRARNYPHTLSESEVQRWQNHRTARLTESGSAAPITLEPYLMEIEQLAAQSPDDGNRQAILRALYQYAENL